MSPVEIWLIVACALLLAVAALLVLAWRVLERRSTVRQAALEAALARLEQRVEELCRRESARETAEAAAGAEHAAHAEHADWVITFDQHDDRQDPATVSTQQVVGTALGEPLIKAAAFSHGVRRALREEKRAHLAFQVRREYRRRRRASRSRARAAQRGTSG